jgi:hypothetical protein
MNSRPSALWLPAVVLGLALPEAQAVDRITVEIAELTVPGARVTGASASLDLTGVEGPTAHVQAQQAGLGSPLGDYRNLQLTCGRLVIREPRFACRDAQLGATGGPLGSIGARVGAEYNTARSELVFEGSRLQVAGGTARFDGKLGTGGWNLQAAATQLDIQKIRTLAAPWLPIPADLSFDGRIDASLEGSGSASALDVNVQARTPGFNFTNEAGTIVAEKVAAVLQSTATRTGDGIEVETRLEGTGGQALVEALLLDFGANPLQAQAHARWSGEHIEITGLTVEQKNLSKAHGTGQVVLGDHPRLAQARLEIDALQFPAAYTSFLQIALAATDFGTLQTTGTASGVVTIADNQIARIDGRLSQVGLEDTNGKFSMQDVNGALHWIASESDAAEPSYLAWNAGSAYGLSGGPTRIEFLTRGRGFELTKSARLPIFDGAIVLDSLRVSHLGVAADLELAFDGRIEPISMPRLSRAFGWPELNGQLAGRIPGLTYRNRELTVQGDLTANVFDGTVVGRNFRLRDPLGPWPRLFADVTARRLDLALVTSTFSIGSITGRLDADLTGMELFDWSPVAFDARLYSTPGDRSKKLISQKAVTSISSVGGGGGGVTAALQSGVLRFFDDFRYDRIGISCRLRNEVCLMSGIEPAGIGYYMVKGRGIPRIDIIGNAGRVDWRQLVAQVVGQMKSEQKATVR